MYQVYTVKDHGVGILIISSINRVEKIVNYQKADLLSIELVNTFELEDLRIDLADKKVYQLINKANNTEYYGNQVKDKRH